MIYVFSNKEYRLKSDKFNKIYYKPPFLKVPYYFFYKYFYKS